MKKISPNSMSRRSFVTTAAAGLAALGAVSPIGHLTPSAEAQSVELASDWNPSEFHQLAHHPARVKQMFDVTGANDSAFEHIGNSFNALQFGFGIPAKQIQIVAVMRAAATFLIFDDYIWKKYNFGVLANIKDPKTGKPAERNIYYPSKTDLKYPNTDPESPDSLYADTSIQALQHRGLRILGCHVATWFTASYVANKNHLTQPHKEIFDELVAHTLPGVLIVAAAVAAIALLQSEGHYSYLYV